MKIKYTYIERIEITGPSHGSATAFEYCAQYGYHVIRSGPKRLNAMKVDSTKYVIVAERETPSNVADERCSPSEPDGSTAPQSDKTR